MEVSLAVWCTFARAGGEDRFRYYAPYPKFIFNIRIPFVSGRTPYHHKQDVWITRMNGRNAHRLIGSDSAPVRVGGTNVRTILLFLNRYTEKIPWPSTYGGGRLRIFNGETNI